MLLFKDGRLTHNRLSAMTQSSLTQEHFDKATKGLNSRVEGLESTMTVNTRDIISHFNKSQGLQNERLERVETKLDGVAEDVSKIKLAVVDLMATDRHIHNLVRELRGQGLTLDESKIFVS